MSGGDQATVHTRLQEPHHLLAWEDFAIELKKSRQNMAQVLRALVREHIQPMRRDLDTAVRRREAAARRRRYRKAFRKSLSDAIGEFLVEARGRSTGRAAKQSDLDAVALAELGMWVASQLAALTAAKERHDPRAKASTRKFVAKFVERLGFALYDPSNMMSTGRR
jgi:DNA-binding transcriptional regulator YhcF (GntR family)